MNELARKSERFSGILLHPTALPCSLVNGGFGEQARDWLKLLSNNGINVWQFLPLSPTDNTGSPYSSPSGFALNPWFLDANDLLEEGFISEEVISEINKLEKGEKENKFNFEIADKRTQILSEALIREWNNQNNKIHQEFNNWSKKQFWLEDHALFMEIRKKYKKKPWWEWPESFSKYNINFLRSWRKQNETQVLEHYLLQWHLDRQWESVRKLARELGVLLFGDMPFYVSRDSVDVWSNRKLFSILSNGDLYQQSGVPPDYFSETGQLWGNPVYRWERHKATNYRWWRKRFRRQWQQVDLLRLDHFRALDSYWAVPGDEVTAENGYWAPSPGLQLLSLLRKDYNGKLPLIAEDLGVITKQVENLRDYFELPGMKILQFAFDGNLDNPYLPENIDNYKSIVYTGTHDNPTTIDWWQQIDDSMRQRVLARIDGNDQLPSWKLIEIGLLTNTYLFIAPLQDLLSLGEESRFNKPGTIVDNWEWRIKKKDNELQESLIKFGELAKSCGRSKLNNSTI